MFRKFLEPKIERRIKSLNELHKYLDERWLARSAEKEMAGKINFLSEPIFTFLSFLFTLVEYEPDELNPSLYSFHSNIDEKNKLLYTFSQQGIETVVDRVAKKNRIKDWIQSSVITEEDEMEVSAAEGFNQLFINASQ